MKKPFFINIIPSNDRQDDTTYFENVRKFIAQTKKDIFSYSLFTLGNNRIDPWILAQALMAEFKDFNALIAVNPFYQHPLQIIKKLSALQSLYSNRLALNLIPGSFENEMKAVNDLRTFEQKKNALLEFNSIIKGFLKNKNECSHSGEAYQLNSARIYPPLNNEEVKVFFSGMSLSDKEDGYFVQNIKPLKDMNKAPRNGTGLIMGVCARASTKEAITAIKKLYPDNRQGQMLFDLAVNNDNTPWNVWIKKKLEENSADSVDFNLQAMRNFWSPIPFIVGSYEEVAALFTSYMSLGHEFFILDFHPEDFSHVEECIKRIQTKS